MTTHSPLIALGTADVDDATMVTLRLDTENRVSVIEEEAKNYKGMRADQVLTSVFELPIARSGEIGDKILKFRELFMKDKLSEEERKTFDDLKDSVIKDLPEVAENAEDLRIRKDILKRLAELENDLDKSGET